MPAPSPSGAAPSSPGEGTGGGASTTPGSSGPSGLTSTPASDGGAGASQPAPGVLTAGMWDDNLNYGFFGRYRAVHTQISGDPGFLAPEYNAANAAVAQRPALSTVDAAIVIDTTGSMGDEIAYLKAEFANIAGAVAMRFPSSAQRWALIVYRDTPDYDPNDAYIVNTYDFTADMQAFQSLVGMQSAANGGDYPESPELGLGQLPKLSWRAGSGTAKLAFWVGDAPHHDERAAAMKKAIVDTQAAGIRIYPVSASGTNDLLELTMRSAAQITGGRYTFLTDDSGVGDPHKAPEIPCYYVTHLRAALLRAIGMELGGAYVGPDGADVVRVSGSPTADGTCTTWDGQEVRIF
jgi:hypothetical protein